MNVKRWEPTDYWTQVHCPKFVRAEYHSNGAHRMKYFWECNICGKEFSSVSLANQGVCRDCRAKHEQEIKERAKANALQAGYKKAVSKIKKRFDLSQIPSLKIDGELYLQRNAVLKALNDILAEGEKES